MGIKTQAGDLLEGLNNAKNLLLRNTPPGDFEASTTYDFWEEVRTEYQQGGLIIYLDDDNYIKLVRLFDGYHKLEFLAEMNGTIVEQTSTPIAGWVPIKISRIGNEYRGSYSTDGVTWRPLGQPIVAHWSNPRIGLMAYSRIEAPEIVAYFEYFRVHTR